MEYTVEIDQEKDLCTISATGDYERPKDAITLQLVAKQLREEQGIYHFLYDLRRAEIEEGTLGAFKAARSPVEQGMMPYEYKIALVYQGDMTEPQFIEDVVVNMGFQVRVFNDIDVAKKWLLQG